MRDTGHFRIEGWYVHDMSLSLVDTASLTNRKL